ncbi:MAG: sulfatase-like hydrolase/transferase [Janthinobacterium lividum]
MNRRQFVGLSSAAALSATAPAISAQASARANAQPNFLFFIADDLMYRTIHSVNNPEVHTPNIDRLVHGGVHFSHCFHAGSWSGAVCVASRTMLNTGLSPFKAQRALVDNQSGMVPMWGQTLRNAGYRTFQTGKWHLDAVSLQRSFTDLKTTGPGYLDSTHDPNDPAHNMYDRPAPGNLWSPTDRSLKGHWLDEHLWLNGPAGQTKHSSEVYADSAISFLDGQRGAQPKPFFMYVAFNAPHDPRQAPEAYQDMYPAEKIALPPNYLPQHPFDQGDFHTRDEQLAPFPRTKPDVQTHRKEYYAIITHMDAQIGRVLDALEASGKANNTYVILTADHGLAVGEHGLMGKQNQYECSMRMPLIMKGPGIKPGTHVDEMVYQHSMYATTCDLAGIPVPPHVEFPSLKAMALGQPTAPLHDAMFGWLNVLQRSIRTRQHKLIFYVPIKRYQLFDLQNDPWEMHDLVDDPQYASVKTEMIARLKAEQRRLGDPLDIDAPPAVAPGNSY